MSRNERKSLSCESLYDTTMELCKKHSINIQIPVTDHLTKDQEQYYINLCHKYLKRDEAYENKHLLQEITIIHKLDRMICSERKPNSIIIDVGGGNGDLSYLIYNILNVKTIVIDPQIPNRNIDNITDPEKYSRIVSNIDEVNLENINYDIYI